MKTYGRYLYIRFDVRLMATYCLLDRVKKRAIRRKNFGFSIITWIFCAFMTWSTVKNEKVKRVFIQQVGCALKKLVEAISRDIHVYRIVCYTINGWNRQTNGYIVTNIVTCTVARERTNSLITWTTEWCFSYDRRLLLAVIWTIIIIVNLRLFMFLT